MKTERASVNQMPRLDSRFESCTPRGQAVSNRLEVVIDKCLTLRHDLSDSWKSAKYNASSSLSTYETAKRDIIFPQGYHWNSDPNYQTMRTKISNLITPDSVKILSETVPPQKNPGSYDGKQATIAVQRTKVVKRKFREVEERLFLPLQMLGKFQIVQELDHHQRGFGEEKEVNASETETLRRRDSAFDEMDQFWKTEIKRYDQSHSERVLGTRVVHKIGRKPSVSTSMESKEMGFERHFSPLQRYILNHNSVKLASEDSMSRRHQRLVQKMQGIQPSPDVLALSKKYLKKSPVPRKPPIKHIKISKEFNSLHQLRVPKKTDFDTFGLSENEIMEDIRKEMMDTKRQLQVETILVRKDRDRFINRGK